MDRLDKEVVAEDERAREFLDSVVHIQLKEPEKEHCQCNAEMATSVSINGKPIGVADSIIMD